MARFWRKWMYASARYGQQLGGFVQTFEVPEGEAFAFATVHGAGHEVPTYRPEAALQLFKNYLAGTY